MHVAKLEEAWPMCRAVASTDNPHFTSHTSFNKSSSIEVGSKTYDLRRERNSSNTRISSFFFFAF